MLYKLPKDRKTLSKDTQFMDRINKLSDVDKIVWFDKYDNYAANIVLYESLLADISGGKILPDSIQNKKFLESEIPRQENELLHMLNISEGETDLEKLTDVVSLLIGEGSTNIRPGKGDYSINKITSSSTP
jgi:hypothetical protein